MNFHWQNFNKDDNQPKRHLFAGRAWWNNGQFLRLEWALLGPCSLAAELHINDHGEAALQFHISALLFSVYIGTENRTLYRLLEPITKRPDQKYTNGRVIGINYFEGVLRLSLWDDPMESRSVDPKWWHISIDLADLIFGKAVHTCDIMQVGPAEIDMPEGKYPATYKVERRTWKRPRWFIPKVSTAIWFEIPAGIPHWGKGENSWDCGMDGTFGIGADWRGNVYDAAKAVALKCLATRSRYGGLSGQEYADWRERRLSVPVAQEQDKAVSL